MEPKISGLTILEPIRENARFSTFKGTYQEKPVFVKVAADTDHQSGIWHEAAGLRDMKEIDIAEKHYRVPEVLYVNNDVIITSWADGELMMDKFTQGEPREINHYLSTLLDLFTYLDSRTTSVVGYTRQNRPGVKNRIDDILEKLDHVTYQSQIDPELVKGTGAFARRIVSRIESRFTHGDLQPGNLMVDEPVNIPTVIDCEHCSWLWPRHYSPVNFVFNYSIKEFPWLRRYLPKFLNDYLSSARIKPEDAVAQLNFSAAMRSLQSIYESKPGTPDAKFQIPDYHAEFLTNTMKRIVENKLFLEI